MGYTDNPESIIFELGGVIVNLDYGLTIDALSQLAGRDISQQYGQHRQAEIFSQYEIGAITTADFRHGLRQLLQLEGTDAAIDEAWCRLILDFPSERIKLIRQLGQHRRIFLLSNINELHLATCDRKFIEATGHTVGSLAEQFERAYYSHLVGDRKPNPSIFEQVITDNGLVPEKTLFLDDTAANLIGAQAVGLTTRLITPGQTIESLNLLP